jgi:glycosyltransferase involved in cell wall biosynthesis
MSDLTIVIPTFNRQKKLLNTIESLLPQLNVYNDIKILVLDNASNYNVNDVIKNKHPNIKVLRNKSNIGGAANIVKCFELVKTKWMWLLGDDDLPMNNAIEIIVNTIENNPKCIYINFASYWCNRKTNIKGNGIGEFIDRLDSFDNTLFMSVNIYRTEYFKKEIYYGYIFLYSMASHYAMMLMAINNNSDKSFLLTSAEIVNWQSADEEQNWSSLRWRTVIMTLLELPLNINNTQFKRLSSLLPNRSIYGAFVDLTILSIKDPTKINYYDNMLRQLIFRNKQSSIYLNIIYKMMLFLKKRPSIFKLFIKIIFRTSIDKLAKKRKLVDLFNRF